MTLDPTEQDRLSFDASRVFRPASPINQRALFAGRVDQLRAVIDAVNQPGQHAIVFGERGVGKTSLANVLYDHLRAQGEDVIAPRVNCDASDDFSTLWRKVLGEIEIVQQTLGAGFTATPSTKASPLSNLLPPERVTPHDVRRALGLISAGANIVIIILDEFDRILENEGTTLMADTIKTLSDQDVPATLVIVGVADDVDQLIAEHLSIERALVQVRMPRMSRAELEEIIDLGLDRLGMEIDHEARDFITSLSQGLPHYTHLLALYATREAIDHGVRRINMAHVNSAIEKALVNAQQSILSTYHKATLSPRRENLYDEVLLACALAQVDELGYFAAADVRRPMKLITDKAYEIPAFARHLSKFCDLDRGPVLTTIGGPRRSRYRFANPLMQPFVLMHGLARRLIRPEMISSQPATS